MTIGKWARENDAHVTKEVHWEVRKTSEGTFAVVFLRTLVLKNSVVVCTCDHGCVMRGSTRPADAKWSQGSKEAKEAEQLLYRAGALDAEKTPVRYFKGFNRVMDWELESKPWIVRMCESVMRMLRFS